MAHVQQLVRHLCLVVARGIVQRRPPVLGIVVLHACHAAAAAAALALARGAVLDQLLEPLHVASYHRISQLAVRVGWAGSVLENRQENNTVSRLGICTIPFPSFLRPTKGNRSLVLSHSRQLSSRHSRHSRHSSKGKPADCKGTAESGPHTFWSTLMFAAVTNHWASDASTTHCQGCKKAFDLVNRKVGGRCPL